ncbi:MAG: hypothetical protein K0R75_7 [Paenibacillaceae bacterium]|nr:hypothetical protein [Paenibacillaceae bacterium]
MNELNAVANKLYGYEPQLYPEDVWDENLQIRIGRLKVPGEPFPGDKQPYALALKAGLLLWDEALDASHTISQNVHNRTGSYWHGLMHRMEGDYSNAKYWFRETGSHPIFADLGAKAAEYLKRMEPGQIPAPLASALRALTGSGAWKPDTMIDCVELQVTRLHDDAAEALLRKLQWIEFSALMNYTYDGCCGGRLFDDVG